MGDTIRQVQIYSATRPTWNKDVDHLKLGHLSRIAQAITLATGILTRIY
ncbi:MAG: hypothetical protein P8L18_03355 [Verrucomicrobiota bacterium]|jgi:hypothetical protein|nr:hypothetical protein [Verrucomicrobiota bacterium]